MSTNYKKRKVVMLPTEKASKIFTYYINGELRLIFNPEPIVAKTGKAQHLYFLSDEEIKEGDIVMYKERFLDGTIKTQEEYKSAGWNLILSVSKNDLPYVSRAQQGRNAKVGISGCYKVIASTDQTLGIPSPSDSFIKEYCESGGISEVLIEYENIWVGYEEEWDEEWGMCQKKSYQTILKVAPDNTISIFNKSGE